MRRRLMLKSSAGVSPVLPAEYQQVEWIGYIGANNYLPLPIKWGSLPLIRARIAKLTAGSSVTVFPSAYTNTLALNPWGSIDGTSQSTNTNQTFLITDTFEFTDFVIQTFRSVLVSQFPNNKLNFGYNSNDNAPHLRFASLTIESNNNIVFSGVMCYRKQDNKIGIYDTVSESFYESTGTWEKGNDI